MSENSHIGTANLPHAKMPNTLDFASIPIDKSWSFIESSQKDTSYITHSYYTYPAKFIPQLASRLIREYSKENEVVLDLFMGSGTSIVESLVNRRKCVGVDINEIAYLVSKAKITPLCHNALCKEFALLEEALNDDKHSLFASLKDEQNILIPSNERIDFWFKPKQKAELAKILYYISRIEDSDIKNFFMVSFAQILKSASIWLQKSIKPTRDMKKEPQSAYKLFLAQSKKMIKKNQSYYEALDRRIRDNISDYATLKCEDARFLSLEDNSINLIVTSPPYVTSYEYADLHQLPSLWLGIMENLGDFRKKFIGSNARIKIENNLQSALAEGIINSLKGSKKAKEVANYYADMLESFIQMQRVLKKGAKACVVIGNTRFNGVNIANAEVFVEQMENIGFKAIDIIHREIPSKMLPSTRDSKTGRFSKIVSSDKLVYPSEYILVMEKM